MDFMKTPLWLRIFPLSDNGLASYNEIGRQPNNPRQTRKRRMFSRILAILFLMVPLLLAAEGKMYKWTDDDGVTVYSQTPPPSGTSVEVAPPPPPASAGSSGGETAEEDEDARSREKPKRKGPSSEDVAASEEIREQNCNTAKANYEAYKNLGNRLIKTKEGLYKRLTDEEREQKMAEAQAHIDEYCREE
jgi:hypothetical protein